MNIAKENRSDLAEMCVCVCVFCGVRRVYVPCLRSTLHCVVLFIILVSTRKSISAQQLISPSNTKELMKKTLPIIGSSFRSLLYRVITQSKVPNWLTRSMAAHTGCRYALITTVTFVE